MDELIKPISAHLGIKDEQVQNTLKLLEEGNTVPFIARYRKEMTHNLDEEQIQYIAKEYEYQCNLKERKEDVLRIIETQGKLTDEIVNAVNACTKLSQVDDLYRPYQQKRKTRAGEAIRKGLQPLADLILSKPLYIDIEAKAATFLNEEVTSVADAIQGAKDIIAENISEDAKVRWKIKENIETRGRIVTKEKKGHGDDKKVYQLYYDHNERISNLEPHRVMAMNRAEKEKVITITFDYDREWLIKYVERGVLRHSQTSMEPLINEAIEDGLKRLLFPSVEREIWKEQLENAEARSIEVFSFNLEKLLLQAPMKDKIVLGFDPAFRTGCKLAVLDSTGKVLKIAVIFPHPPVNKTEQAEKILVDLINTYHVQLIAIGNGTASRESERFVEHTIKKNHLDVQYAMVSEAGASVYSASELARQEFPDLHVEERSAISIGRRLQDPLSELIKIDPKSIGVGQYQHDLPEKALTERLDFTVLKSVNRVGVDLNTASKELLMHISGINKTIAQNIIDYRNSHGRFVSRKELKEVKGLGPKAFEQSAGFLRVTDGEEPLDQTSIHPESYKLAKNLLKLVGNEELGSKALKDKLHQLDLNDVKETMQTDEYTLNDIVDALSEPLRDYREQFDGPMLRSDILEIKDLQVGQELQGTVRNVTDFGVFIDIGLHEDGLLHKSKMIKGQYCIPSEMMSVGEIVTVYVYKIDEEREKVQLCLSEDFL